MEFKIFVSCLVVFILCNKALGSLNSTAQETHEIYEEKANIEPESHEKTLKNAVDILVVDPIKTLFAESPQNTISTVKKVNKSNQNTKSDIQSHVSKTEKKAIVDIIPRIKKTVLVPAPTKTVEIKRKKIKKVKKHDPDECELCGYERHNKIHNPPKCNEMEDFHEELIQTHLDEYNEHDVMGVNQLDRPENQKRDVPDHKDDNHLYRQKGGIVFYEETEATTNHKEKEDTRKEKKIPILNVYLNKYGKTINQTVTKNKPTNDNKTRNKSYKNASEKVTNEIIDVTNIEMTSNLNEDKTITEKYKMGTDDDTDHSNQINHELEVIKANNQITGKTETEIEEQTGKIIDNKLDEHVITILDDVLTKRFLNVSTNCNKNHEEQLNNKIVEPESGLNLEGQHKEDKNDVVITNDYVKEMVERFKYPNESPHGISYGGSNVCSPTRFPYPTAGRRTDVQYENYLKYLVQLATQFANDPSFGYQKNAQYMNYPNYGNHASTPIVSSPRCGSQISPQYGSYPKHNQVNTPYASFPQYSPASSPKYGNQASITYPTFSKYEPQSLKFPDVFPNHEYETQIQYDILPNYSDQTVLSVDCSNPDSVSVLQPCETDLESEICPKYENQNDILNRLVPNDGQEIYDHEIIKLSNEEIKPAYREYSFTLEGQRKNPIAVCNPLSNNINYKCLSQGDILPRYPGIKDKLKHAYLTPNANQINLNNQNIHKPDYKYTPPSFRYPFQNQLRNMNLKGDEKVEYVYKYEPWSNFRNFQSKTTFPDVTGQKYYDWHSNKQNCPNQPRYYNSYDPKSNYIYSEVIVPNEYLDRIWRSWRKTEIHLKNAKNNAPLPIGLNQSNVDGKKLNKGTIPVNRRKIASDSNGCYGNLGKPWHSRVDYNPITN